jgi:hypothetical protein
MGTQVNGAVIDLRDVVKTYKTGAGSFTAVSEHRRPSLASLWPALRATQGSVREALSYE